MEPRGFEPLTSAVQRRHRQYRLVSLGTIDHYKSAYIILMQVTEIESSSTELWTAGSRTPILISSVFGCAGSPAARPTAPNEPAAVL